MKESKNSFCSGKGPDPAEIFKYYQNTMKSLMDKLILYCIVIYSSNH